MEQAYISRFGLFMLIVVAAVGTVDPSWGFAMLAVWALFRIMDKP